MKLHQAELDKLKELKVNAFLKFQHSGQRRNTANGFSAGFDAAVEAVCSLFSTVGDAKPVSEMTDEELRKMLDGFGSVTARYDPVRKKNIVSIQPPTDS